MVVYAPLYRQYIEIFLKIRLLYWNLNKNMFHILWKFGLVSVTAICYADFI